MYKLMTLFKYFYIFSFLHSVKQLIQLPDKPIYFPTYRITDTHLSTLLLFLLLFLLLLILLY